MWYFSPCEHDEIDEKKFLQQTACLSFNKLRGLGMRLQRCLSVVSCSDHVRRRGLVSQVSQVQIFGLAPEAWSSITKNLDILVLVKINY